MNEFQWGVPKIEATLTRNPSNYTEWSIKAKQLLKVAKLWDVVSNTTPQPIVPTLLPKRMVRGIPIDEYGTCKQPQEIEIEVDGNEIEVQKALKDYEEWAKTNELAKLVLINSFDGGIFILINVEKLSSSQIWTTLEEYFKYMR